MIVKKIIDFREEFKPFYEKRLGRFLQEYFGKPDPDSQEEIDIISVDNFFLSSLSPEDEGDCEMIKLEWLKLIRQEPDRNKLLASKLMSAKLTEAVVKEACRIFFDILKKYGAEDDGHTLKYALDDPELQMYRETFSSVVSQNICWEIIAEEIRNSRRES